VPDEPKRRGPFAFAQEISVDQPAPSKAYFILESDWDRIKRMIREIVPYGGGFQVLWSLCTGICASSVFGLVSLVIVGDKAPIWTWTVTWVAAIATLLLAILAFFVDRGQRKAISRNTSTILEEMTLLEKRHQASQEQPNDVSAGTTQ
jgi:hypothetical protein